MQTKVINLVQHLFVMLFLVSVIIDCTQEKEFVKHDKYFSKKGITNKRITKLFLNHVAFYWPSLVSNSEMIYMSCNFSCNSYNKLFTVIIYNDSSGLINGP